LTGNIPVKAPSTGRWRLCRVYIAVKAPRTADAADSPASLPSRS
jgi:hypothetical protein